MSYNELLFTKYSPLKRGLESLAYRALQRVGTLPPEDLTPDREAAVAAELAKDSAVGVTADFAARFASKREDRQHVGASGPTVTVIYHIPATGRLDLLKLAPEASRLERGIEAWISTAHSPLRGGDPYPITEGEIQYEIPAAMPSEEHKRVAADRAEQIERMVALTNAEIAAFSKTLESDIKKAIAARRDKAALTSTTLDDLDVPLR